MKMDSGEHMVSFRISASDQITHIKYLQNVTSKKYNEDILENIWSTKNQNN